MNKDEIKKLIKKELEKYEKDKSSFKSYIQCMDDVSAWLQGVAK